MKILPLVLLGFVCAASVRADLVIYAASESSRVLGQRIDRRVTATGYALIEYDTGQSFTILGLTLNGRKYFSTAPIGMDRRYQLTGPGQRTYTYVTASGVTNTPSGLKDSGGAGLGLNVPLLIRTNRTVSFPRTISGPILGVLVPPGQSPAAEITQATFSFAPRATRDANHQNETLEAALARYRALFLSRGYTEITQ